MGLPTVNINRLFYKERSVGKGWQAVITKAWLTTPHYINFLMHVVAPAWLCFLSLAKIIPFILMLKSLYFGKINSLFTDRRGREP